MTLAAFYLLIGIGLWAVGLHGLLVVQHPLRRIIAINVMGSGVFLVMIALAARAQPADPVLHALVVTGLVVAISATAFAVRLAGADHLRAGAATPAQTPAAKTQGRSDLR